MKFTLDQMFMDRMAALDGLSVEDQISALTPHDARLEAALMSFRSIDGLWRSDTGDYHRYSAPEWDEHDGEVEEPEVTFVIELDMPGVGWDWRVHDSESKMYTVRRGGSVLGVIALATAMREYQAHLESR